MKFLKDILLLHWFLLCCALCFVSLSQAKDASSRILFSRLGEAEGFDADRVTAILDDHTGMIWLTTDDGLIRFDGAGSLTFNHEEGNPGSLSSDRISSAVLGPDGTLWIGTEDAGLNKFDPLTLKARKIDRQTSEDKGFRSESITCLGISDGKFLWVGTREGVDILHIASGIIQTSTGIPPGTHMSVIFVQSKQLIWAGTENGELFRWNQTDSKFELFWTAGAPVTAIAEGESDTELWVGTRGQGLLRLDTGSGKAVPSSLESRDITSIQPDSNGDLWVATSDGLAHLDRGISEYRLYRNNPMVPTSLSSNKVSCLFESWMKVLWVGTDGGGVSRFPLNRSWFPHYRSQPDDSGTDHLPNNSVWSIAPAKDGTLWIGTEFGFTNWNPVDGNYRTPDPGPDIGRPNVSAILEMSNGNVWAGTKGNGLIVLPGGDANEAVQFRHQKGDPRSIGHDFVSCLFEDSKSSLWIGTHGAGLWKRHESDGFSLVPGQEVEDEPKKARFVMSVAEDKAGRLWVAATDGLFVFEPGSAGMQRFDQAISGAPSLSRQAPTSIMVAQDGSIFVGTSNRGLNRIKPETGKVKKYNRSNSDLPSNTIHGLLPGRQGMIWISTPEGVARLDLSNEKIRIFDDLDGLQKNSLHPGACATGSDGMLYFGGGEGFNQIDPNSLPSPRHLPTPILTGFERFGEPVIPVKGGILEKSVAATSEIRLPYNEKERIAFRFANLNSEYPFRGKFRFRLVGHDEDWLLTKRDLRAGYSGLRPGKYEFQVQNSSDGLKWNVNQSQVKLTILPPWWQTWWARAAFLIGGLVGAAVVFWLLRRAQIQQMHRREEQLKAQCDRAEAQLAVQLQNATLLERRSQTSGDGNKDEDNFAAPLKNLADYYGVNRCLLCRLQQNGDQAWEFAAIGEYRSEEQSLLHLILPAGEPLAVAILGSEDPIAEKNFLAMRTSFQGVSNGVLLLERSDQAETLSSDQAELLRSVAIQFGIAIAQKNLTDVEEVHRQQLDLSRQEAESANHAKSKFLARMTHDLRTPLTSIIGFTQLFKDESDLKDSHRSLIKIIGDSGNHLLDVINEILDVSKIEAGKIEINPEPFDLVPFLDNIQEVFSGKMESKGLAFDLSKVTRLPLRVETDRSKLRQILINLLGNAIKFTDHGSIGLKVAAVVPPDSPGPDEFGRRQIQLGFQLSDTGQGIAEEDLPKLFKEFSQTNSGKYAAESTGLGLSIAKAFVNLLGGDITVKSKEGQGTTFEFSISCEEVIATGIGDPAHPGSAGMIVTGIAEPARGARILIADDRPLNRLLLMKVLSQVGFDLVEAVDGREACEKWRETNPDLILMDQNMPEMNGVEATQAIFAECGPGTTPVIVAVTANAFDQARVDALASGFNDFISKPFKNEELLAMIAKHLGITYTYKSAPPKPMAARSELTSAS